MLILETQTRPICLFDSQQSTILLPKKNSFLNCTKHYHELLVVKNLVYLALARLELFSLVQSICKDTLNKTCTAYNRFDESVHQRYFEKAAKRHIK